MAKIIFKEPRKPLPRNINCAFLYDDTKEIREYAEKMWNNFFNTFPDIDCWDLLRIAESSGGWIAGRTNICERED